MDKMSFLVTGSIQSPHDHSRALAIARSGSSVTFLSLTEGCSDQMEVVSCNYDKSSIGKLRLIVYLLKVILILISKDVQVIHSHYADEILTWLASLFKGKRKFVISVMGGDILFGEQSPYKGWRKALTLFALKRADIVTVKSSFLFYRAMALGISRKALLIIYWGVDKKEFLREPLYPNKLRADLGIDSDLFVIFSPRMCQPLYNQDLMIKSLSLLVQKGYKIRLLISTFGSDTVYQNRLVNLGLELGVLQFITFIPPSSHNNMAKFYKISNLVFSLPNSDGFPQCVIEAGLLKKVSVVSNRCNFGDDLKHLDNVILVNPDVESICSVVRPFLEDPGKLVPVAERIFQFSSTNGDIDQQVQLLLARLQ